MDALERLNQMTIDGTETFCSCEIKFKDEEDEQPSFVVIKLNSGVDNEDDEDIFFYCNSVYELESLCDKGNPNIDFYIYDIYDIW